MIACLYLNAFIHKHELMSGKINNRFATVRRIVETVLMRKIAVRDLILTNHGAFLHVMGVFFAFTISCHLTSDTKN